MPLMTQNQVAETLGYKPKSFKNMRNKSPDKFPKPDYMFGSSPRWEVATIENWIKAHKSESTQA